MKILALGDPHGKLPKNLGYLVKKNEIGIIACMGDIAPIPIPRKKESFTQACERSKISFENIVLKLCSYNLPLITLRGNTWVGTRKNNEVTNKIFSQYKNLINKRIGKLEINGINFIFFDMTYGKHSIRNPKNFKKKNFISNTTRKKKLDNLLKKNEDAILLSHAPPYSYLDKIHSGKHVGSKILLNAIKKYQPKLVLCGHIHEAKGKAKIGKTIVYNLGDGGDYAVFDVDKRIKLIKSNFL